MSEPIRDPLSADPFRKVVEEAPCAMLLVGSEGRIGFVNAETERLFGYGREELIGQPVEILVPERFRKGHPGARAGFLADPRPRAMGSGRELFALRNDGTEFPVEIGLNPAAADGQVLATVIDITGRKALEAEHEARQRAETELRTKRELMAQLSQEVLTPLKAILGTLDALLEGPLEPPERQRAETVHRSVTDLARLADDILDLARAEAVPAKVDAVDFDLAEVVEDVAELMSAEAAKRRIDLAAYVDPALRTMFRGDPALIRRILLGLVENALRLTDQGAVSIEVKAAGQEGDATTVRFDVIDTGIGVPSSDASTIFETFAPPEGATGERLGGSGLGLAVSRRLAERLGCEIGVVSSPGLGSDFWFTVRLGAAAVTAEGLLGGVPALEGLRALVVGAPERDHKITARQLEALGLSVAVAEDGFAAAAEIERRWYQDRPYDLLVADQAVSEMTGEALARRIREDARFAAMRIVLLASAADAVGPDAPVDAVLTLPIRHKVLAERVAQLFPARAIAPTTDPPASSPALHATVVAFPTGITTPARRILVAEDNDVNRQVVVTLLRRAGYHIEVATNGAEAVQAAADATFDLILMDVHMPVFDGAEATQRIRAFEPPACSVPIVALTANAMAGARERFLALGMDDYLSKPFRREELLEIVARWVPGRKP